MTTICTRVAYIVVALAPYMPAIYGCKHTCNTLCALIERKKRNCTCQVNFREENSQRTVNLEQREYQLGKADGIKCGNIDRRKLKSIMEIKWFQGQKP